MPAFEQVALGYMVVVAGFGTLVIVLMLFNLIMKLYDKALTWVLGFFRVHDTLVAFARDRYRKKHARKPMT